MMFRPVGNFLGGLGNVDGCCCHMLVPGEKEEEEDDDDDDIRSNATNIPIGGYNTMMRSS